MSQKIDYRNDIDGMRAIAVLAVILFHMSYLEAGYLGVDVFFTISGFLITSIVYGEVLNKEFSIVKFYERRIRRILPLVVFISSISLIIGVFLMLPDDLENLSQSIIASIFFLNNILLLITSQDYWAIANEYKPLMHSWSLAIEEQFYIIYPLLFYFLAKRVKIVVGLLMLFTIISFILYLSENNSSKAFYLIQYRFWELSIGGVASIVWQKKSFSHWYKYIALSLLLAMLCFGTFLPAIARPIIVVGLSVILLVRTTNEKKFFFLDFQILTFIGKISFSLYMWHQVILAYTRYALTHEFTFFVVVLVLVIIFSLSILTYFFIEQPFRNKNAIQNRYAISSIFCLIVILSLASGYIYLKAGVISDVPELGLKASHPKRNIEAIYNSRIDSLDKPFSLNNKLKILVVGNSFGRDWANILLESSFKEDIEISYTRSLLKCVDAQNRINQASLIFFSELNKSSYDSLTKKIKIDSVKVWNVGTKNFGVHNGINFRLANQRCDSKVKIDTSYHLLNRKLKSQWKDRYIDLLSIVSAQNGNIKVFTEDCKFISLDCKHLTSYGASFFANYIENNQTDFTFIEEINNY